MLDHEKRHPRCSILLLLSIFCLLGCLAVSVQAKLTPEGKGTNAISGFDLEVMEYVAP